ncbi:MAG: NAD(P)H-dependent oxidoreductase subunit E [Alphaproteobacteria bacterium GM202ARS2]|nr:NAD(P)H-dependent oxidoreductase subunit E [Alphaproteobacteria bacterium GM202ARS2]
MSKNGELRSRPVKQGRKQERLHIPYPKGRQADGESVRALRSLLLEWVKEAQEDGTRSLDKEHLIEILHVVQDTYKHISARHITALSELMGLPLAHIYEVATFYAHFDVVLDDESPPPPLTIRVCDSLSCALAGAEALLAALRAGVDEKDVRVVSAPCMGRCDEAPVVQVGQYHQGHASTDNVLACVRDKKVACEMPAYQDLSYYQGQGGYRVLQRCLAGELSFDEVVKVLEDSALKGMGGAGFPAGNKWRFVRREPGPRLMTVNADEGEPGTFKDRYYMESTPHRFLEGMLIAAWAVEATDVYIYLRDEYPSLRHVLSTELIALKKAGLLGSVRVHLRRGAGAYICGEESAMLSSIEGRRGFPWHKPPYISSVGLFGRPTLNQNVETLHWVSLALEHGSRWFLHHGASRHVGTDMPPRGPHSFSVSGRVKKPGVKLVAAGITMNTLLNDHCGGMLDGHTFKGYLPGGASGGILPASMANIPLDFGQLEKYGCFLGSAAVIVLSDKDSIKDVVVNLLKFFEDESCGQCTPCRVGTEKAVQLVQQDTWDEGLLNELIGVMGDASICGLGQAAGNPIRCALQYFREELY